MRSKLFFVVVAAFWVVMNVLLWRSQSAAHSGIASEVRPQLVWDKILTAPDNSSLDIYDHDTKIGFCQWMATAGAASQAFNQTLSEDYAPDGLLPQPSSYQLTLEGNSAIFGTNRVRFEMQLRLGTNEMWQDFHWQAKIRPTSWDIHAIAAAQKVALKINDDGAVWQKSFKFSDFEDPDTLLEAFGGPGSMGVWGQVLSASGSSVSKMAVSLQWQAHEDWMRFGHSRVKVYRLETEFLGQHLYVFTSRVGEILWVEAPNKLTLRNVAFSHF